MTGKGTEAERAAEAFLRAQGLRSIDRNFRCRLGEIDLVMQEGDTLVFVEVRLRASAAFGGAAGSITAPKRRRIIAAAKHYLAGLSSLPPCRFDAVLMTGRGSPEWIRDAFGE